MPTSLPLVYLKEISVPTGYQIDTKSYNVTLAIGKTTTKNVTDKRVNAKINIAKQDAETGNAAQGDATLEGAVYGLYAREDIVHPDGRTGTIHKKDSLITSLTTDKNGEASVSDLYLGKYYLKELSAPVGYVLDPTEHTADVQKVEMKDDVTKVKISKQDIAGKELPGAKLTILDQNGKVVELPVFSPL